ncbi:MAG: hypothetical protein NTU61_02285 [Candidatus Altiarchaeota archaeon]|nr:hypothetical protein [Candidatus Altiarchaeota archaeon]
MSLLKFDSIRNELMKDGEFESLLVLVRDGMYSFRTQIPALLLLTDEVLFYGGCAATESRFKRIPLKSIHSVAVRGWHSFKCVEVKYLGMEGERMIFFCPFTGEPHQPKIDVKKMKELHARLKKNVK